jgi:hypothetical protein
MVNSIYKRHQRVKILVLPDSEFLEYHNPEDEEKAVEGKHPAIKKGMTGEVNMVLPNGRYHVALHDSKGKIVAYAPFDEEDLQVLE